MHGESTGSARRSMEADELIDLLALGLFTFVFTAQVVRVALGWEMQLGPYPVPMAASYVAILGAGFLTSAFARKTLTAVGVRG